MLPVVMARLCDRDWNLVSSGSPSWAMDWLGYFPSAMDWLGYLFSAMDQLGSLSRAGMGEGFPLSGHGLGRDHLYQGPDWGRTICL